MLAAACVLAIGSSPGQDAPVSPALEQAVQALEHALAEDPAAAPALRAAISAALAEEPLDRRDQPFLDLLLRLTRAGMSLRLSADLLGWLEPRDAALAGQPDAEGRHAVGGLVANALLGLRRSADARARVELALDDFGEHAPLDGLVLVFHRLLAVSCYRQRDYRHAQRVQQKVVDRQRQLAADKVLLEDLRLLGRTQHWSGDRGGAYTTFEEALQLAERLFAADDLEVANSLHDFGSALVQFGDYRAAYELGRREQEIREAKLPPDSFEVLSTKQGLSQVLVQLGDRENARRLQEEVLATGSDVDPRVRDLHVLGKLYLARTLYALEDYEASRRWVVEMLDDIADRPETDRDLGTARSLLGCIERRRGDFAASRQLLEASFAGLSATLPLDHSFTQIACSELLTTSRLQGDVQRAVELSEMLLDAVTGSLRSTALSARATARLATIQRMGIDAALSLALGELAADAPRRDHLVSRALEVSQLVRGAAGRVARVANRARSERAAERRRLDAALDEASHALRREPTPAAELRVAELVRERERLEREVLLAHEAEAGRAVTLPTLDELAAALPTGGAAAAFVTFTKRRLDPAGGNSLDSHFWFVAIVLHADGRTALVDLGSRDELLDLVDGMSAATHKLLRHRVLDPVLAAAGEVDSLLMALDDGLCLVPWDALPTRDGAPMGEQIQLRRVGTLLELLEERRPWPSAGRRLLAVGDIDYDVGAAVAGPGEAPAAPPLAMMRGDGRFERLTGSRREIDAVEQAFRDRFPDEPVVLLTGKAAGRDALHRDVPGATIVHFATHGFVAYDRIASRSVAAGSESVDGVDFDLTPFRLSGLALTGANAGADAGGVITAEELQSLDLGSCYLAVLSACESALGAWSGGQGFASMHEALHVAGARYVVSTLWPVNDLSAQHVMTEFYRQLLAAPTRPHEALWLAKMKLRSDGAGFADWAAFQLSGL